MYARSIFSSVLLVGCFCLLWAVIESVGATGLPGEEVVWMRYATHLTILTALCWWRYRSALIKTQHPWTQLFRSLLMFGMPLFFLRAATRMDMDTLMMIFWLAPLLLLVGDRKAVSAPVNWVAFLVAYAGVVLLHWPIGHVALKSLALPAGMAACFAGYVLITRKLRKEMEVTNLFHTAFWVLIAMSFRLPTVWRTPSLEAVSIGIFIGAAGLAALFALDVAVKRASPGIIGAAFYLQPVFVALIQMGTMEGHPSRRVIAALVLVCAAVALQLTGAGFSARVDLEGSI